MKKRSYDSSVRISALRKLLIWTAILGVPFIFLIALPRLEKDEPSMEAGYLMLGLLFTGCVPVFGHLMELVTGTPIDRLNAAFTCASGWQKLDLAISVVIVASIIIFAIGLCLLRVLG